MKHKNHDHKECVAMFKKLSEHIDNELDKVTCSDIKQHALNCIPCKTCLETLRQTVALCKDMADQPVSKSFSLHLKEILSKLAANDETLNMH